MRAFRISFALPDGTRLRYLGLFLDGFEAILQTLADYPNAKNITARRLV